MKSIVEIKDIEYNDWISEGNHKFECKECEEEIYGKKCKWQLTLKSNSKSKVICLSCFLKGYEEHIRFDSVKRQVELIKKKYAVDLIVEEL